MNDETNETTRVEGIRDFEERADAAMRSMELLREVLVAKVEDLASGQFDASAVSDVLKVQRELGRALNQSLEQEGKVADARRIERGGDGLDLAAARAEVRSRLDRILARNGAGAVSG